MTLKKAYFCKYIEKVRGKKHDFLFHALQLLQKSVFFFFPRLFSLFQRIFRGNSYQIMENIHLFICTKCEFPFLFIEFSFWY